MPCQKPVRKIISNCAMLTRVSLSSAKKAGFKVYKKISKGEYERQ